MVGGQVGAGGRAEVEGVVSTAEPVAERWMLFVGGPKHGQMLDPYGGSRYVVAIETTHTDEPWPDDRLYTQVTYTRSTMVLDVDDRRYARSMFIDTRLWSGIGPIPPEVRVEVNDAIVRAWMAGGRDVTDPYLSATWPRA